MALKRSQIKALVLTPLFRSNVTLNKIDIIAYGDWEVRTLSTAEQTVEITLYIPIKPTLCDTTVMLPNISVYCKCTKRFHNCLCCRSLSDILIVFNTYFKLIPDNHITFLQIRNFSKVI